MKNIVTLCLVGFAVFGLFSFGVSGFEGTYFPEFDSYVNCTVSEAVSYSSGVAVASSEICLDDNRTGRGIAIFNVENHSRIVSVQVVSDTAISGVNISVGKDGQYTEFGEYANFSMGISPDWNQTLEMYIRCEELVSFELWAKVVPGVLWRNGSLEVDNPDQPDQKVLVGIVTTKNEIIVDSSGYGQGMYNLTTSGIVLARVWLEPAARQTEVFIGTDEAGFSVWEDQKRNCWLEQRQVDISVDTDSEEDFDICGCFRLANGGIFNTTLSIVNVSAIREEHRGVRGEIRRGDEDE